MFDGPINQSGALAECAKSNRAPSVRDQLVRRKDDLTTQLAEVTEALAALDENLAVEKVLTLVGRTVRF